MAEIDSGYRQSLGEALWRLDKDRLQKAVGDCRHVARSRRAVHLAHRARPSRLELALAGGKLLHTVGDRRKPASCRAIHLSL